MINKHGTIVAGAKYFTGTKSNLNIKYINIAVAINCTVKIKYLEVINFDNKNIKFLSFIVGKILIFKKENISVLTFSENVTKNEEGFN